MSQKLMKKPRFIAHIDMDAFFAAIEQRDSPAYRGKPVVVGADPRGGKGRGVVSTCSYEARRFGIHSAMPISIAYRLCPAAIFLPPDMEKYEAVSRQIYEILYAFTPDIEPVSIDEAFLDITGSYHLFGPLVLQPFDKLRVDGKLCRTIGTPLEACLLIKKRIKEETGLAASCGLAPTKMAAKIASDLKKPDGMVEVKEEGLLDFLWPLGIRKLWGLGEKSEAVLNNIGIKTIGDIAKRDIKEMIALFGRNGGELWRLANGIDESPVETEREAKSISNEVTFESDTKDSSKIEGALLALSEKVSSRLRRGHLRVRTVTLKIRLEGFKTYTRAVTVPEATNFTDVIYKEAKSLYNNFDTRAKKVRLVGVKVSGFSSDGNQRGIFDKPADAKKEKIYSAIDRIRERLGDGAIYRAGTGIRG